MYVDEIAALFRSFVDEDDTSWLTPANVASYLKLGHSQYYREVAENQPYALSITTLLTVTGNGYNLATGAVKLMGSTPTQQRLVKAIDFWCEDAAGNRQTRLTQVADLDRLERCTRSAVCKIGTILTFNAVYSAQLIRIVYLPEPNIDWTKQTAGQNEYVDDFAGFHELIALNAAQIYAIRDGKKNAPLDERRKQLTMEFQAELCQGQLSGISDRVSEL